ncbi:MAG: hypothetical protein QM730_17335 [Anaerolineales bacterium]
MQNKSFVQWIVVFLLIVSLVGQVSSVSAASSKPSYEYYVVGNSGNVTSSTTG